LFPPSLTPFCIPAQWGFGCEYVSRCRSRHFAPCVPGGKLIPRLRAIPGWAVFVQRQTIVLEVICSRLRGRKASPVLKACRFTRCDADR